jgi:hypothetical protein
MAIPSLPDNPPSGGTSIPAETAAHLLKFLEHATPEQLESLLSTTHSYLQAGLAERALAASRHILARDAS